MKTRKSFASALFDGVARLGDVSGSEIDTEATGLEWVAVGEELWVAMETCAEELPEPAEEKELVEA